MTRKQLKRQVRNTRSFRQIAKRRDAVRIAAEKARVAMEEAPYFEPSQEEFEAKGWEMEEDE